MSSVSLKGALSSSRQGGKRQVVGHASSPEVSGPELTPKPDRSEVIASAVSCMSVATSSAAGIARASGPTLYPQSRSGARRSYVLTSGRRQCPQRKPLQLARLGAR
jgi:hypothetical protein